MRPGKDLWRPIHRAETNPAPPLRPYCSAAHLPLSISTPAPGGFIVSITQLRTAAVNRCGVIKDATQRNARMSPGSKTELTKQNKKTILIIVPPREMGCGTKIGHRAHPRPHRDERSDEEWREIF